MGWTDLFYKKNAETADSKVEEKKETLTPINPVNQPNQFINQPQNFSGGVDQNLITRLDEIFAQANQPGLDLYEFIVSLKKLDAKPIDERTKYETTYDIMSTSGLTKEMLIKSGQSYMSVFAEVKQEFEKEFASSQQNTVANLNAQADSVLQENAQLQKQIEDINKKISENLVKMQQLRSDAATNESKLMQEKMNFENTHTTFVNGVQKYITGVEMYIK